MTTCSFVHCCVRIKTASKNLKNNFCEAKVIQTKFCDQTQNHIQTNSSPIKNRYANTKNKLLYYDVRNVLLYYASTLFYNRQKNIGNFYYFCFLQMLRVFQAVCDVTSSSRHENEAMEITTRLWRHGAIFESTFRLFCRGGKVTKRCWWEKLQQTSDF